MEGLAVAMLGVTGIVANAHWWFQCHADAALTPIHQCQLHIVELNNKNDSFVEENGSLESYIEGLIETEECMRGR